MGERDGGREGGWLGGFAGSEERGDVYLASCTLTLFCTLLVQDAVATLVACDGVLGLDLNVLSAV
jgi:hypothetical protein